MISSIIALSFLFFSFVTKPIVMVYNVITGTDKLEKQFEAIIPTQERVELEQLMERNERKTKILILDLDETLLHSSLQAPEPKFAHLYQYSLNIYIDNTPCTFYVSERPYLKNFMKKVCDWYQVVIFTASVKHYADPVIDRLYYSEKIAGRYFRESCSQFQGMFIKDLSNICKDLSRCIILDNSPISYMWQQENAIPCESWMADNDSDQELLNILPFLEALRYTSDVRNVLRLRLT